MTQSEVRTFAPGSLCCRSCQANGSDAIRRWLPLGSRLGCPDDRTGYFFWQTLVGAWPLDVERATRYMHKAMREAKVATSWQSPDLQYEEAVQAFVTNVLTDDDVMADVAAFVAALEPYARANSLAQKLIQLTMPGVPDTYQGCELAAFTLVDPDNRGAVDFTAAPSRARDHVRPEAASDRNSAAAAPRPSCVVPQLPTDHRERGRAPITSSRSAARPRLPSLRRGSPPTSSARVAGATLSSNCPRPCRRRGVGRRAVRA